MGSFHGLEPGENLQDRYIPEENLLGRYRGGVEDNDVYPEAVQAWRTFVGAVEQEHEQAEDQVQHSKAAFATFLHAVQRLRRPRAQPRVFVSHRHHDVDIAQQIAWQATQAAKDYWLDVHDGPLTLANKIVPQTHPRYALILAGIIEMGLLGCTHVIATHTQNSLGSKWIPYELARAKSRQVISSQAAGWFDASITKPDSQGEYVVLAEVWRTRAEIDSWLGAPRAQGVPARRYLGTPNPPKIVF